MRVPFRPSVAVKTVGPQSPPQRGPGDSERLGGLSQTPRMGFERANNSVLLPLRECRRPFAVRQENRLAQVQAPDSQSGEAGSQTGKFGQQVVLFAGRIQTR